MADKTAEQLSVLVDGECEVWELEFALRRLGSDPELKARWQSYHLISDALRNNLPDTVTPHFAERMRAAIAAETPLHTTAKPAVSSWYKPVAGLAVAASVGLLAVALWSLRPGGLNETASPGPVAGTTPVPYPRSPVMAEVDRALESRLNSYLVNHNEYASMNSVNGVLPYVHLVGYQSTRR
jgi:sigma-E factor negative regulatory protein RseA